jgi:RNA polymerase sigma-70 factor (ECF subfamily)
MEGPDARSLLEGARSGDAEAFGEVCRIHEARLLRQAMTLCGNPTVAEELAQDTLVEAWKSLHRYNGRCQFFTWLCAILLNRHRNNLRRKNPPFLPALPESPDDLLPSLMEREVDSGPAPDEQARMREQAALVLACLRALPAKHQQVIYLRFYVDQSLEGIASALGCSLGTVKSRLFHGLEKLRQMRALTAEFPNPKNEAGVL